jgi:hypothetical protein
LRQRYPKKDSGLTQGSEGALGGALLLEELTYNNKLERIGEAGYIAPFLILFSLLVDGFILLFIDILHMYNS